jgi:hypothetical protein
MFNIVWSVFIEEMLPAAMRKPKMMAFVATLLSPIVWVYDQFAAQRTRNLADASVTPQVFSLQKTLNDRYDARERRIVIDSSIPKQVYIYTEQERRPQYLPMTLSVGIATDFVIEVPNELYARQSEITNTVRLYALPSKKFKIILI